MKTLLALAVLLGAIQCGDDSPDQRSEPPCDGSCFVRMCRAGADPPGPEPEGIRTRTTGDNGTFDDRCAPDNQLVQYKCEVAVRDVYIPELGRTPLAVARETGRVISTIAVCGNCVRGACPASP
jgi:hypothetical protein